MKALTDVILKTLETRKPGTVEELVHLVQEQVNVDFDEVAREIKNLQRRGLLTLEEPTIPVSKFADYLTSRKCIWFWLTSGLTLFAFISIVFFPETGTPLSYLRYMFAFVLAVFLPGYCLTETLFPRKNSLDEIERFTFSVGLSFAITALTGLFLSLTPFGLTLATELLALGLIIIVLALVSLSRKFNVER